MTNEKTNPARNPAATPSPGSAAEGSSADSVKSRLKNNVRRLREDRLLTKAELARKAGISTLTIDRVEAGMPCRMDTKRKIILALGMTVAEKDQVFVKPSSAQEGAQQGAADGEEQVEVDVDDNHERNG